MRETCEGAVARFGNNDKRSIMMHWKYTHVSLIAGAAFLLTVGLLSGACETERSTGTISGNVIDSSSSSPVAGATITTEPPTRTVLSDGEGFFAMPDVEEGTYIVYADADGYIVASETIVLLPGMDVSVTISLVPGETSGPEEQPAPAHQSLPWVRTGGPLGGIGYDIRYKYDDYKTWYVTDANAGLHKSTDSGITWFKSNSGMATSGPDDTIPVFCVAADHINPDIVWAGTQFSGTIYKSTDGGSSWEPKKNGIDDDLIDRMALTFRGITVDPQNSDTVYAMGEISSYGWSEGGDMVSGMETDKVKGVVYRTTDGGENWTELWRGDNLARYCWIDPRDTDVLYVSTGIFDREASNSDGWSGIAGGVGIVKSTDGGVSWETIDQDNGLTDLYVGSLYMHPENPDILLAGCGQVPLSSITGVETGGVFLSTDAGRTWKKLLGDDKFTSVEISTLDTSVYYAATASAVYRSDDAGSTWQKYTRENNTWGSPGVIGGTPIDMQCDPADAQRVFINSYLGGVFLSTDGGRNWTNASSGYTGAEVKELAVAADEPERLYAGGRTGVFSSTDGGTTWTGLANSSENFSASVLNEIAALSVDPEDSQHVLTAGVDIMGIVSTEDGGESWEIVATLPVAPLEYIFAPSDPTVVYANVTALSCWESLHAAEQSPDNDDCNEAWAGLYVSTDGGKTWSNTNTSEEGYSSISMAVDPEDAQTVYAYRLTNELYRTTDAGASWEKIGNGLPQVPVLSLAVDRVNPETLYAGTLNSALYRSTDSGQTWTQASSGLNPEAEICSIMIDAANPQVVYAADTGSGVYVSTDGAGTWKNLSQGLDNRKIVMMALSADGSVLYAGSSGDGTYRLGSP